MTRQANTKRGTRTSCSSRDVARPRRGCTKVRGQWAPIGVIRTPFRTCGQAPVQGRLAPDGRGRVEVFEEFAEGLKDLDGFSHAYLLYLFHKAAPWKAHVVPYLDAVPRGLFATRAPSRPNPIGLTVVEIAGVRGSVLEVKGVDMLDGSLLLDIKPYIPRMDVVREAKCGWLEDVDWNRTNWKADGRFKKR